MSDDEERLVGFDVAIAMTGISRAEIYRRIDDKRFPTPHKDGRYRSSRVFFSFLQLRRYVRLKLAGQDWTPPE